MCDRRFIIGDRLVRTQSGGFLLEALAALLIFSFGLLAMAGLYARAVGHFNEAQFRANAAELVHGTLAAMRAMEATTVAARFDPSTAAPGWLALLDQAKRLPGVSDTQNLPTLEITDGPSAASRQVSLAVFWQVPGDVRVHRYAANTIVGVGSR